MSAEIRSYDRLVRGAMRREVAVQGPDCPEPETLLDWIEQEEAHPAAALLLGHLFTCAYCRREYTDLCRIVAMRAASRPTLADIARSLPDRARSWARELITAGITTPVASIRVALQNVDRLAAASLRSGPGSAYGAETPYDLRPAFTAVRSTQPVLRWSAEQVAPEYQVVVQPQTGRRRNRAAGPFSAGPEMTLTLPETAALQPGGVYLWQVIAHDGGRKQPSAPAGFVVLTEAARRRVEALEQDLADSPLGLIGLYESHGLYAEAVLQAETLLQSHGAEVEAVTIHERLLRRLSSQAPS
jgi:hypothetical protein